jgi:hypothetical protein
MKISMKDLVMMESPGIFLTTTVTLKQGHT